MKDVALSFGFIEQDDKVVIFMLSGQIIDVTQLFNKIEHTTQSRNMVSFTADLDAIYLREEV